MRDLHDDVETPAGPGAGPDGGRRHPRRHRRAAADRRRAGRPRRSGSMERDPRLAGHEFNVNSTPQLRTVLYDELGLTPGAQDEDRVLDRRRHPRVAARPAPDRRDPAALPRGREAPLDLRREPAGRGGGRRPDPRVVPPDRRPHRPALLGAAQPPQHPGAHRGRASGSGGRSCRPRAAGSWWPTTTRSSCGCIAHLSGDPGLVAAFAVRGPTSTGRWPPASSAWRPTRSPAPSATGRRWSPTAWPTAWRPTGWPGGWRRAVDEANEIMAGTSAPSRRSAPTWTRPSPRPGPRLHADRLRSQASAARAGRPQLPGPPGGRAPGHERRDPGAGRRPLQGGAGPARPGAGGRRPGQPAGPPGPRRGDRRRGARRGRARWPR